MEEIPCDYTEPALTRYV